MDGFQVVRQLKADPAVARVPVIAVTAYAMVGDRERVLSSGFDGYISKPIDPQAFISQLQAFINREHANHRTDGGPRITPESSVLHPSAGESLYDDSVGSSIVSDRSAREPRATILVVDDSPLNLQLMQNTLTPANYRVVTTDNTREALALARNIQPDLILSDWHIGRERGDDLIRKIRDDSQLAGTPFVFISSTCFQEQDSKLGLALGALKFISRPIEPARLLKEIENCLAIRQKE
jgi:two-component system cell cycle response regulator